MHQVTGAEIKQAFVDALHLAFEIVPLHALMEEEIEALRQWARGRARNASHRDRPPKGGRKLDL